MFEEIIKYIILGSILLIIFFILEFINQYIYLKKIILITKTKHKQYWKKTKSFQNIIFTYSPMIRYLIVNHSKLPKDKEILKLAKFYRIIEIIKYFVIVLIVLLIIIARYG
jgi:hypothetical protein